MRPLLDAQCWYLHPLDHVQESGKILEERTNLQRKYISATCEGVHKFNEFGGAMERFPLMRSAGASKGGRQVLEHVQKLQRKGVVDATLLMHV